MRFARRRPLLTLFVVALIVRLLVVGATPRFTPYTDSLDYDRIAVSLVDDGTFAKSIMTGIGGPTALRGPAYPVALAAAYEISGVSDATARWQAGRVEEALFGAVTVVLLYLLALRLFGAIEALVTGAVATVYPPLLLVGSSLMTEALFIPLMLGAILCALRARDGGLRWSVLTGVLVGLATLTRTDGLVLIVPLGLLVWRTRPRSAWRALRAPLTVVAALLATLAPWTIRDYEVLHRFVPISTEGGYLAAGVYVRDTQETTFYPGLWRPAVRDVRTVIAAHPRWNEAEISARLGTIAVDYIEAHPFSLLRTIFWNSVYLLNLRGTGLERIAATGDAYPPGLAVASVYVFWLAALIAIAGLCGHTVRTALRRVPPALWLAPGLLFLTNAVIGAGTTRYRSLCDPFLLLVVALALIDGRRRWEAGVRSRRASVPSAAG